MATLCHSFDLMRAMHFWKHLHSGFINMRSISAKTKTGSQCALIASMHGFMCGLNADIFFCMLSRIPYPAIKVKTIPMKFNILEFLFARTELATSA